MVNELFRQYRATMKKSTIRIGLFVGLTALLVFISLSASDVKIGLLEGIRIFVDHMSGSEPSGFLPTLKDRIVFEQNMPRALGAILAGATLSICGASLQSLIRNPLADPYTLGISSGAMFGMVLSVGLGISIIPFINPDDGLILNAFVMSLLPTAVIVFIATFKKVTPTMMILTGIAVMYIFTALTTLIKYSVEAETLSFIYQWSIGSVSGISWENIPKMIAGLLIAGVPMIFIHRRIDIVAQGDEGAIALGINPNKLRIISLILASLATSIIVCYTGTIGFVGLVAPHIARIFVGSMGKMLIPASAALGAFMVLGSDYIVRLVDSSLPVGVILALVCSPVFILILIKMRKSSW